MGNVSIMPAWQKALIRVVRCVRQHACEHGERGCHSLQCSMLRAVPHVAQVLRLVREASKFPELADLMRVPHA